MKVINSYVFRAICSMLIGLLLFFNPERMTALLIQVIGGIFLLSGLVTLINYIGIRLASKTQLRPIFPVAGLGSFLFGLVLLVFPVFFITYLMYGLGIVLIIASGNQIAVQLRYRNMIPVHWVVLVSSLLLLAAGLFILLYPMQSASLPFLILGICCVGYGVSELVNGVRLHRYEKKHLQ